VASQKCNRTTRTFLRSKAGKSNNSSSTRNVLEDQFSSFKVGISRKLIGRIKHEKVRIVLVNDRKKYG
jgi:hypothetical protein